MKATIFEIKRFAVHDGNGIRTTVFFKGCPLRCAWCHNPEGIGVKPCLAYYAHKCISCASCTLTCPQQAHRMDHEQHIFNRAACISCGDCTKGCLGDALTLYGNEYDIETLLPILLEDREFYENTNGGVTLSGGECLLQGDFCAALLRILKQEGIHTAVDTCGYVPRSEIDKVLPFTDAFLYDLKAYDDELHRRGTGCGNKMILENLLYLDSLGARVEIRIPYIPDYNADQIEPIAQFLSGLRNITGIRVLPYHRFAAGKYQALGIPDKLPITVPSDEEMILVRDRIAHNCNIPIII